MAISKKASIRKTSPEREAACQRHKVVCGGASATQNLRQFAKTRMKAIRVHTQARGQRQQAKRDSR